MGRWKVGRRANGKAQLAYLKLPLRQEGYTRGDMARTTPVGYGAVLWTTREAPPSSRRETRSRVGPGFMASRTREVRPVKCNRGGRLQGMAK